MNIQHYLPNKKILFLIITLLVVGIGYTVFNFTQKRNQSPTESSSFVDVTFVEESDTAINNYYKDSDNDGAYDWEEALWPELDPNDPDSDDDGVLDGRYIQVKQTELRRERLGDDFSESNLTETQKFGRGALSVLIALQQSGEELTPETQAQITENLEDYIINLNLGNKIYLRDEFQLVDNTPENSYAYRDTMQSLLRTYPIAFSDLELLIQGVENAQEYQGSLRSIVNKYEDYITELTTIPVPFAIAGRHTELTNNVNQILGATNNLLQEESDELISLAAIIQLEKIMNEATDAIIKINTYFDIIQDPSVFQ